MDYTIDEILEEYPHIERQTILKTLGIGKDALYSLSQSIIGKVLDTNFPPMGIK